MKAQFMKYLFRTVGVLLTVIGRCCPLRQFVISVCLGLFLTSATWAAPFTKLVVFGDSLSDVGNSYLAIGWPQSPPYWQGRASDGPLWVEDLAVNLGVPSPTAYLAGGTNCAISGTTTSNLFPNLGYQVSTYLGSVPSGADPGALYTIWSGANDFFNTLGTNPGATELTNCAGTLGTWANRVAGAVTTLYGKGARDFIIPNLPPLGNTPKYAASPNKAAINSLVVDFNSHLANGLATIAYAHSDVQIRAWDVFDLFNQVLADPGSYGLTNVTDPAMTTSGADPTQYLFWDDVHPTAVAHSLLAAQWVAIPGDANYDGSVDHLDAAAMATYWLQSGGWSEGDFNDDGVVDAVDATILAVNWGYGTSSESAAVPEPNSLAMLVWCFLTGLIWCRRRKSTGIKMLSSRNPDFVFDCDRKQRN